MSETHRPFSCSRNGLVSMVREPESFGKPETRPLQMQHSSSEVRGFPDMKNPAAESDGVTELGSAGIFPTRAPPTSVSLRRGPRARTRAVLGDFSTIKVRGRRTNKRLVEKIERFLPLQFSSPPSGGRLSKMSRASSGESNEARPSTVWKTESVSVIRTSQCPHYFCASARRFTIIPEKRTM